MEGTHRNKVSQMLLAREGASTKLMHFPPWSTRGAEMDRGEALRTAGKAGTVSTGSITAASQELILLLHSLALTKGVRLQVAFQDQELPFLQTVLVSLICQTECLSKTAGIFAGDHV